MLDLAWRVERHPAVGVCLPAMGRHRQRWELRLGGQPGEKKGIAKEKNKIQIFISHNCILDLGLDPAEAESSSPAQPGLEPGPHSPGVCSPPAELRACPVPAPGTGRTGECPRVPVQHSRRRCGAPQRCSDPSFPSVTSARVSRAEPGTAPHRRVNSPIPHRMTNPLSTSPRQLNGSGGG